jgi:hypothetical protein
LLHRHTRLFDEGLNENHFDLVVEHFSDTLNEMNVDPNLIDEALDVIMPIRAIFAKGAEQSRQRKRADMRKHHVAVAIVVALLAIGVFHIVKSSKKK